MSPHRSVVNVRRRNQFLSSSAGKRSLFSEGKPRLDSSCTKSDARLINDVSTIIFGRVRDFFLAFSLGTVVNGLFCVDLAGIIEEQRIVFTNKRHCV